MKIRFLLALSLLGLPALAATAIARPLPGGPAAGVCRGDCRAALRECITEARESGRACLIDTCLELQKAARQACATARESEECRNAMATAQACSRTCTDPARSSLAACRNEARQCAAECPVPPPPPGRPLPDPACAESCTTTARSCLGEARTANHACLLACRPLVEEALSACGRGSAPATCRPLRQQAHTCQVECSRLGAETMNACSRAQRACLGTCPAPAAPPVRR